MVTGASSGIGTDMARQLSSRGYGTTLVARRADRLEALAAELRAAHGTRVEVVAVDLGDAEARATLLPAVAERGLTVEVLVNNAGFSTAGRVADIATDRELALVRTNVEAVVDLCSRVVPEMVERGRGAILNVASTVAYQPFPGQATYGASRPSSSATRGRWPPSWPEPASGSQLSARA